MNGTHRIACCCLALALGACRQTVIFDRTGGVAEFCADGEKRNVHYTPRSPDVIVALDRSVSMSGQFTPTVTAVKLTAALAALDTVSQRYRQSVRFGFVAFPGLAFGCSDNNYGCCAGELRQPFTDLDSFRSAAHACDVPMPACPNLEERPTGAALSACRQAYSQSSNRNRYVLLMTDGEPTCNGCDAATGVLVRLTNDHGVKTFVVVLGNVGQSECLTQMALLGDTGGVAPFYRPATSPEVLADTIGDIVGQIATGACQLDLQDPVDDADRVAVDIGTVPVARGGPDGWDFDDKNNDRITLRGASCKAFLADPVDGLDVYRCIEPR